VAREDGHSPISQDNWDRAPLSEAVRSFGLITLRRKEHIRLTERISQFLASMDPSDILTLSKRIDQHGEWLNSLQADHAVQRDRNERLTLKCEKLEKRIAALENPSKKRFRPFRLGFK